MPILSQWFTRYKVPRTNTGVRIFLWPKVLPVYPCESQSYHFLLRSWVFTLWCVITDGKWKNLTPFSLSNLLPHPPQYRSSPLLLKAHCCLATLLKTLIAQLAQYSKSMVTVSLSFNMANRTLFASNDAICKGSIVDRYIRYSKSLRPLE